MARFDLNILGCGSALPTSRHLPSCQVLNVRDNLMMIDCGEGAQLQMRRMRLKTSRLTNIFISHLHGDHCFGLVGLLSTLALQGKTSSVTIHTFKEGVRLFKSWTDFFCRDASFEIRYNEIPSTGGDLIYSDNAVTVTTIALSHRVPCVGFLVREKPKRRHIIPEMTLYHNVPTYAMNALRDGEDFVKPDGTVIPNDRLTRDADPARSYAYCSDTVFSRKVIEAVTGVDWLYHEATYDTALIKTAVTRGHSTAAQAAEVAREAAVKRLIIGHYSKRYESDDILLNEALSIFPNTVAANEGQTYNLLNPG